MGVFYICYIEGRLGCKSLFLPAASIRDREGLQYYLKIINNFNMSNLSSLYQTSKAVGTLYLNKKSQVIMNGSKLEMLGPIPKNHPAHWGTQHCVGICRH
jgi:hypothetical protein